MKELSEYTNELHRRVEMKIETQRQHRRRILTACVPLALALVIGVAAWPHLAGRAEKEAESDPSGQSLCVLTEGVGDAAGPDGVLCKGGEDGTGIEAEGVREQDGEAPEGIDGNSGAGPGSELTGTAEVPEDFSFALIWGCYGISSYDSADGRLVKTSDAAHPEDYAARHELSDEERREAWSLLSGLDLESYPADYDPYNDPDSDLRVASEPSRDLVLTLRTDGTETTVACRGICMRGSADGYDDKARAFLTVCDSLSELLMNTPEWQALPDYELYYE